jgi:hypothetical protein
VNIVKFWKPSVKSLPKFVTVISTQQANPISSWWCNCDTFLNHRSTRRLFESLQHNLLMGGAYSVRFSLCLVPSDLWYSQLTHRVYITNSVAWVRKRTIPTKRPPLVGEIRSNFCGKRVPDPYCRILSIHMTVHLWYYPSVFEQLLWRVLMSCVPVDQNPKLLLLY